MHVIISARKMCRYQNRLYVVTHEPIDAYLLVSNDARIDDAKRIFEILAALNVVSVRECTQNNKHANR